MNVLLIEDDEQALNATSKVLKSLGADVTECADGQAALECVRQSKFDLILSDVRMPRISGYEFLRIYKTLLGSQPMPPLVFMTAFGQLEDAIWAMKSGAVDFVIKPFNRARLAEALETAKKFSATQPSSRTPDASTFTEIVYSKKMKDLQELCAQVARSHSSVLITGESGVGKERVAQQIHAQSSRKEKPFIALNCAAIPENLMESELFGHIKGAFSGADQSRAGLFEAAHGGTLFLDELGEMPLTLQTKLLRVLQEGEVRRVGAIDSKKVDVRIVAATNKDLNKKIEKGEFREDLLYRLNVIQIEVPPLRDRLEDLPVLCESIINAAFKRGQINEPPLTSKPVLSARAFDCLKKHRWPGNIRELSNVLERAIVLSPTTVIEISSLPAHIQALALIQEKEAQITISFGTPLKEVEDIMIFKALEMSKGDKLVAARILGVHPRTIYRRLKSAPA